MGTRITRRETYLNFNYDVMCITFKKLEALEPGLTDLMQKARFIRSDTEYGDCLVSIWYMHFKPRIKYLVGFSARKQSEVLRSERAYDVAYKTIYNTLVKCGSCEACQRITAAMKEWTEERQEGV
jgi:hypothetical protein